MHIYLDFDTMGRETDYAPHPYRSTSSTSRGTPDRSHAGRPGAGDSVHVSWTAGSQRPPQENPARPLCVTHVLGSRKCHARRGSLSAPEGCRLPALRAPLSRFHHTVPTGGVDGHWAEILGSQELIDLDSPCPDVRTI